MQVARAARPEDLEYLARRLEESGGEEIDLQATPCWVVEEDGVILGVLPIRLMWQFEPLYVFPEVQRKASRRRACMLLYHAAETWIADRERNRSGIYRAFAITRRVAVRTWAKAMGWRHQYQRAPMYIKHF
jgi:hypothetical protein